MKSSTSRVSSLLALRDSTDALRRVHCFGRYLCPSRLLTLDVLDFILLLLVRLHLVGLVLALGPDVGGVVTTVVEQLSRRRIWIWVPSSGWKPTCRRTTTS
jgi:hypothetical protein